MVRRRSSLKRDHLVLLRDAGELASLLSHDNEDAFLQRIVELVNRHIRTDVASVYLYDDAAKELVLRGTRGLSADSVGRVRLRPGEGLVGHAFETLEPIREKAASRNPRFKYFAGTNEELYESFLAVPLQWGGKRIGVLVAQRREKDYFTPRDLLALQALASQVANAIENTRLLAGVPPRSTDPDEAPLPRLVCGRVASEGYACAPAVQVDAVHAYRHLAAASFDQRYTSEQFQAALEATDAELLTLQRHFASDLPEIAALIFTAHQMMLMDSQFAGAMTERIKRGENPPDAIVAVARDCMVRFTAHPDPYIREKAYDMEDLAARLLSKLVHTETQRSSSVYADRIAIASELYPSGVIELYAGKVRGIILTHGGETSHVVLLARSLRIPLVIVNDSAPLDVPDGTRILLDAEIGNVYIDPSETVLSWFRPREETHAQLALARMKPESHTRDGTRVHLLANINLLSEARLAQKLKAEGIGLYRSEFPFLVRATFPSEEEQVVIYRRLIHEMQGLPVTIRTVDLGGDKASMSHGGGNEANPQLGLRSLRFLLKNPEVLHQQLRAILRAATDATDLRLLFPMVSSLDELRAAREAVYATVTLLSREGLPHYRQPTIGMMVEVPSVVPLMEEFAREADFFSLGTNDFVQYLLAVDRGNEKAAAYYQPAHPAVLRTIHQVLTFARSYGKDVSVCGEMAHEGKFIPFFLGIGVRTLSIDPRYLSAVQADIETIDVREAETLAAEALRCGTTAEAETVLARWAALSR